MGKWECFKECIVANECKKTGCYCEGQECPIQLTRFFAMDAVYRNKERLEKQKNDRHIHNGKEV